MGKTTTVETLIAMSQSAYLESINPDHQLPLIFQNTAFANASSKQKEALVAPYVVHLNFHQVISENDFSIIENMLNNKQRQNKETKLALQIKSDKTLTLQTQEQEELASAGEKIKSSFASSTPKNKRNYLALQQSSRSSFVL